MFFQAKNPKTEMDSLDRALEILQDRYSKKVISIEEFSKKCEEIVKKKEKYQKKLEKKEKSNY